MTSGANPTVFGEDLAAESRRSRTISLLRWGFATIALWVALLRFPGLSDLLSTENGWKWALGILLQERAQVGTEWIFTYGPLGYFLQMTHVPGLFAARWLFECLAKAALALLAIAVLRRQSSVGVRVVIYATLFCMPAYDDGAAHEILILLAGLYLIDERGSRAWPRTCIALVLATLGLVKFSLLVLSSGTAALVALHLARSRGFRAALTWTATFLGGIGIAWVAAGQSIANVPRYLGAALDLARGYSDAMSFDGPVLELGVAVLVLGAVAATLLSRPGLPTSGPDRLRAALVLLAMFLAFKEGFTRHDSYHSARYFAFALPLIPLLPGAVAGLRWTALPRRGLLVLAALASSIALARALRSLPDAPETWPAPAGVLSRSVRGVTRPIALRDALEAQLAKQRATFELTRIRAATGDRAVDVLGNWEIFVLLSGIRWEPRYCFQSYAAFTDLTVARNAAQLSGPEAPPFLLVDGRAIDFRYPTVEDCGAVLVALQRYRPVEGQRGFLLLEQAGTPSPVPERTIRTVLRPGESWDLPGGDPPMLARIRCEKTLRGILRSTFLRTPVVEIHVVLRDGTSLSQRILPSLETSSFLLSPYLASVEEWIDVYSPAGGRSHVASIEIREKGSGGCFLEFHVEIDVLPELTKARITAEAARELRARVRGP